MYKEKGGRPIGTIRGPCCCIGGCCKSEFAIANTEGNPLGNIKRGGIKDVGMRRWGTKNSLSVMCDRALLSNSDKFQLTFDDPNNTSVDDKLVMVSSLLFMDYLFFEGETNCICNVCTCPPQCWFKLCDWYCCGCSLPCRIKCFIPSEENKK